jgi:hypothetical protein
MDILRILSAKLILKADEQDCKTDLVTLHGSSDGRAGREILSGIVMRTPVNFHQQEALLREECLFSHKGLRVGEVHPAGNSTGGDHQSILVSFMNPI